MTPSSRPRDSDRKLAAQGEMPLPIDTAGLGFDFGHTGPRQLRIGVGNGRNDFGVENAFRAGRHFGRNLGLMHGLMSEDRLANQVSDGRNMRNIGAHLLVNRDKAALVDGDARLLSADHLAAGMAADHDKQTIEQIVRCSVQALERTRSTSVSAATAVTLVFSRMFS